MPFRAGGQFALQRDGGEVVLRLQMEQNNADQNRGQPVPNPARDPAPPGPNAANARDDPGQAPPTLEAMQAMPVHPTRIPLTRASAILAIGNVQDALGLRRGWAGDWNHDAQLRLQRLLSSKKRGAGVPKAAPAPAPALAHSIHEADKEITDHPAYVQLLDDYTDLAETNQQLQHRIEEQEEELFRLYLIMQDQEKNETASKNVKRRRAQR